MARSRNFVFTLNNYQNTDLVDNLECRYIAYSKEIAPTTGTPHLQGYVSFVNAKTVQSVRRLLVGCHVEIMRGTLTQNDAYISKVASMVQRGDKPTSNADKGQMEKERWEAARIAAKSGDIESIDADIYIRMYNTLKNISKDFQTKPDPCDVKCFWIYGPTGTGKSHCVETTFPDCYKKCMDDMKWFDLYNGEEVIYLEDIDKYQVKWGGMLKRLADRWPMLASIKGTMRYIRPKIVIVTSNYSIEEIWCDLATVEPLQRRFKEILKENQEQQIDFLT